jgi:hypothetical protein
MEWVEECPALPCPEAPFGYWNFNETSGTTAADAIGDNDGTAIGAVPFAEGVYGYGRDLGGASDAHVIQLPEAVGDTTMGAYTISFWLRPVPVTSGETTDRHIYTTSTGITSAGTYIREQGDYVDWHVSNGSSYCFWAIAPAESLTPNTWNHLAFTWNGEEGGTYTIYANGTVATSGTASCGQTGSPNYSPSIGGQAGTTNCAAGPGTCGSGQIDELGIWNRPLSAAEVQSLSDGVCPRGCGVASPQRVGWAHLWLGPALVLGWVSTRRRRESSQRDRD